MSETEPLRELFELWNDHRTAGQAIAATIGETCTMELLPCEPSEYIQPMRCTACGHKTYAQLASYCPHCGRRVV